MRVRPCSTHLIQPGEDLFYVLDKYLTCIEERTIIAITSKIISVCENRIVGKEVSKMDLIKQEADAFLESDLHNHLTLTIKNNLLMPASGIDESNCKEGYILYPKNIQADAVRIWDDLRNKHQLQELGVIITDSRTVPLRRGVTGVALGWCGFMPFYDYIGKPDLFGRPLQVTVGNLVDALATAAVLIMGEGDEQTPIALISQAPKMTFVDRPPSDEEIRYLSIPMEEDLYAPLLKSVPWKIKATSLVGD